MVNEINKKTHLIEIIIMLIFFVNSLFAKNIFITVFAIIIGDLLIIPVHKIYLNLYLKNKTEEELNNIEHDLYYIDNHDVYEYTKSIIKKIKHNIDLQKIQAEELKEAICDTKEQEEEFGTLSEQLLNVLKESEFLDERLEIERNIENIEMTIKNDPYKINMFINKYAIRVKDLIELLKNYDDSLNKVLYKEQIDKLLEEFNKYLITIINHLNNKEQINIQSSINVLMKELQAENKET